MKNVVKRIVSLTLATFLSATVMYVPTQAAVENAQIEGLYFTDKFNNVVLNKECGVYTPNIVIKKDSGDKEFNGAKCLVAVYDQNNRMYSVSVIDVNDSSVVHGESIYGFDRMTIQGENIAYPDGGYAKAFLFDDLDKMSIFASSIDDRMAPDSNQYKGKITFNTSFENLIDDRFGVTKDEGIRKYTHNAEPEKMYNFENATEVYISSNFESDSLPVYQYGRTYDESSLVGGIAGTTVGGRSFQGPVWFYQYTNEVLSNEEIEYYDFVEGVYGTSGLRWKMPNTSANNPCIINFGYLWGQGNKNDTVMTFKAPYTGTIKITGTPYSLSANDTDGLSYRISKLLINLFLIYYYKPIIDLVIFC